MLRTCYSCQCIESRSFAIASELAHSLVGKHVGGPHGKGEIGLDVIGG